MANDINILDALGASKAVATNDDGARHRQKILANLIAIAAGSDPATVSAAAFTDPQCDTHGLPYVNTGHPHIQTFRARYTTAQTNTALAAPASGKKLRFMGGTVTTANANTNNIDFQLGFGTGGSSNDASLYTHPGIPNNQSITIPTIGKTGTANQAIVLTATHSVSSPIGDPTYDVVIYFVEVPA